MRPLALVLSTVVIGLIAVGCGSSGSSPGTTAARATTVPDGRLGGTQYEIPKPGKYAGKEGVHTISFDFDGSKVTNVISDEYRRFGTAPIPLINGNGFEATSADKRWTMLGTVITKGSFVVSVKYPAAPDNTNLNWQMYVDPVK